MWKSLAAGLSLLAFASLPARAEAPKVAVSIQPLHSLVAAVMKGAGEPGLIVGGTASEHTYALKPSDARLINSAKLVVLVDEGYEGFLAKSLKTKKNVLAMADLPGIVTLPPRQGGVWEAEHHEADAHDSDHDHRHGHADFDGHVWLDPDNAKLLVAAVAEKLTALDSDNAALYARNAADTAARLDALDARLRAALAPVAGRPYVVFHDAYQYFERRYGLAPAGAITIDPDRPPSAKRLAALRERLKQAGATCVFREPQFPARVVETLANSASARIGLLDPQGAALPPGPDQYFLLMTALADGLIGCLGR